MTPRTSGKPRNNARKEAARNLQRLNPGMSYKQAFRQAGPGRGASALHHPHLSSLLGVSSHHDICAKYSRTEPDLTVPLGVSDTGHVVSLNIDTVSQGRGGTGVHGIVSGTTGSGATMVAMAIALALRGQNNPALLQAALIDPGARVSSDADALVDSAFRADDGTAAAWLTEQLSTRQAVLRSANARDFYDLPVGALPRLVLVVADEATRSINYKRTPTPVSHALRQITAVGRQLGINLLLLCAHSTPEDLHQAIGHMGYRLSLGQVDDGLTQMLLDDNDADLHHSVRNAPSGTAFLRTNYAQQDNVITQFTAAVADDALTAMVMAARSPRTGFDDSHGENCFESTEHRFPEAVAKCRAQEG